MRQLVPRSLRRDPLLVLTTIGTLAIGIAVATALFSYLDVFLHPRLLVPAAERVVGVYLGTTDEPREPPSFPELQRLRESTTFADSIGTSAIGGALGTAHGSRFAWGHFVSGGFFRFFGARAALGRLLTPADDMPGAPPVIVLSDPAWRSLYGADPAIVGRVVSVNGAPLTIVGVIAPGFTGLGYASWFFVPLALSDRISGVERLGSPDERWLNVLTRLPPHTSPAAAGAELQAIARNLDRTLPLADGPRGTQVLAATGFDPASAFDPLYHAARALTAAAVLFLLLAAANIAGLMLARVTRHERDWAVRKALGASPGGLVRALLGHVAVPVLIGFAAGLALSGIVAAWIEDMLQTPVGGIGPGWIAAEQRLLRLDARALAFAITATLVCTVLALVAPAVRVLRAGRREWTSGDARSGVRLGLRRGLVVVELAVAVLLLVGGALLSRSLLATLRAPLGFATDGLVEATVFVPRAGGAAATAASWSRILATVRSMPAVESATLAHVPPNAGSSRAMEVSTSAASSERRRITYNIVDTGYLDTLGIPLLSGRAFLPSDATAASGVVVVNRALAVQLFGTPAVLGRHLQTLGPARSGEASDFEIVGVTPDAATTSALEPHEPTMFFVYGQRRHSRLTLVLRSRETLAALEPRLRDAIAKAAPEAAIIDLVTVDEQGHRSLHALDVNASIASGLAGLALLTALVGLFAMQLFAVSSRRHELGVRLALGAPRASLGRLVLGDGLRLALLGSVLGVVAALAAQRFLRSLLFGLEGVEPWIYVLVPVAAVLVTAMASWIPARQAMRTDPVESLGR